MSINYVEQDLRKYAGSVLVPCVESYTILPNKCYNVDQKIKGFFMKVNYQERIDATVKELKIILSQQRTVINRQKIQALYCLKAGYSLSLTDVAERLGVHRVTVHRWLKKYSIGGLSGLLEIRQSTGRPRVIPSGVIAGLSKKLSDESCEFKSYKQIAKWVENKYKISLNYHTLYKHLH